MNFFCSSRNEMLRMSELLVSKLNHHNPPSPLPTPNKRIMHIKMKRTFNKKKIMSSNSNRYKKLIVHTKFIILSGEHIRKNSH